MTTQNELQNRVALVTGGSRGIGRAICLRLARDGARVAVNYAANRDAALEVQHLIAAEGGEARIYQANVASETETDAMYSSIEAELGAVELLVANAGIAKKEDSLSMGPEVWREIMEVNLHGTFYTVWRAKEAMQKQGFGRIVCISSILGLRGNANDPNRLIAYGTSKAATIAFVRNCAAAMGPEIRVNGVAPGWIPTDMTDGVTEAAAKAMIARTPLKRFGSVEDIANAVHYLLSERSAFITGETHLVCGGMGI